MDKIFKRFASYLREKQKDRRWRRIVNALAALVVFGTAYGLILPAITMDQEAASEEPGIVLEQSAAAEEAVVVAEPEPAPAPVPETQPQTVAPETTAPETQAQTAAPETAAPAETTTPETAAPETQPQTAAPETAAPQDDSAHTDAGEAGAPETQVETTAQSETGTEAQSETDTEQESETETEGESGDKVRSLSYAGDGFDLDVTFDKEITLPEGTKLIAAEIRQDSNPDRYAYYYRRALTQMLDQNVNTVVGARFFTLSFEAEGQKVTPQVRAKVTVTYHAPVAIEGDETARAMGFYGDGPDLIDSAEAVRSGSQVRGFAYTQSRYDYEAVGTFLSANRRAADGNYLLVRQGNDGAYYAMAADGSAVPVTYDAAANTAAVADVDQAQLTWTKGGDSLVSAAGTYIAVSAGTAGGRAVSDTPSGLIINRKEADHRSAVYSAALSGEHMNRTASFYALVLSDDNSYFTAVPVDQQPINATILAAPGETAAGEESEAVTEAAGEESEETTEAAGAAGEQTVTGEDYAVAAKWGEDAGLPEGVQLSVSELPKDRPEYQDYLTRVREVLSQSGEETDISYLRLFDIRFVLTETAQDGSQTQREVEPAGEGRVQVQISYTPEQGQVDTAQTGAEEKTADSQDQKEAAGTDSAQVNVIHFAEDDAAQVLDARTAMPEGENGTATVSFEAESFSVYAIVGTETITTEYISHEGTKYEVTVTYGPEAKIPEGSTLRVTDIEDGTQAYDDARNAVLADKKEKGESVDLNDFNLAALDISIIDPNGKEIEPEATVTVDIKIKELPEVKDLNEVKDSLEIQHHVEVADGVVVEKVFDGSVEGSYKMDTDENIANAGTVVDPDSVSEEDFRNTEIDDEDDEIDASFKTGVFSTFTITWRQKNYNRNTTIHYGYLNGNTFVGFSEQPSPVKVTTKNRAYLIYDFDGYQYSGSTYYRTNASTTPVSGGTRMRPLLRYKRGWEYRNTGDDWTDLANNSHVYVIYEKKPDISQGGSPTLKPVKPEDYPEEPSILKESDSNGDGTADLSLSITGHTKDREVEKLADVIVVFDISGSMDDGMSGSTRIQVAKNAVNGLVDTLAEKKDSQGNPLIRMSLISFSTSADEVIGLTDLNTAGVTNYKRAVNNLSTGGGTNWDYALQLANEQEVDSGRATFVIFVTDGDPTFRNTRMNVNDATVRIYDKGSSDKYYLSDNVFGIGYGSLNENNNSLNFDAAVNQGKAIVAANKNLYSIGISNSVTAVRNFNTQAGGNGAYLANEASGLNQAFDDIAASIIAKLGFSDIEMTDGITEMTQTVDKSGLTTTDGSFTYWKKAKDAVDFAGWDPSSEGAQEAEFDEASGAVKWDMGTNFMPEDGATYKVTWKVWPSQEAYDILAKCKNDPSFYDTLSDAKKAQITRTGTAPNYSYTLRTNEPGAGTRYKSATKSGAGITTEGDEKFLEFNQVDPLGLASSQISIKKIWDNQLDDRTITGSYEFPVKAGDDDFGAVTLSSSQNPAWQNTFYISTGLMTTNPYVIYEHGHDYIVEEPAELSYQWDFKSDVYHPMVINNQTVMLVKVDTEAESNYTIDGKYYKALSGEAVLTAINERRSNLNISKTVVDEDGNHVESDQSFTFTVTVDEGHDDEVWLSAYDTNAGATVMDSSIVTGEGVEYQSSDGYFHAPSGTTLTLTLKDGWNYRFTNLSVGSTYSIEENNPLPASFLFKKAEASATNGATAGTVTGQKTEGTIDKSNSVYTVAYTNEIQLTEAEATKAWKNADGSTTAPANASVVYTLYADGEATDYTVTLDGAADDTTLEAAGGYESEGWKATFVNLTKYKFVNGEPVEIEYTIAETTTYPGYTASTTDPVASGGTITNTQESTTANAVKAWENADGTTTAPQGGQVTYTLYADGTATNYTVTLDGTVDTAPTSTAGYESEAWKAMFQNLPKYKIVNGEAVEIVYTIAETGTYPGYTPSTTDPVAIGETITNKQGSTETYAVKAWKNADGTETAPDGASVVFTLYADGIATSYTVTLDGTVDETVPTRTGGYESEAWKATFVNLPQYQPGTTTEIVYTIAETIGYPGYTASTTDSVGSGSTITNSQDATEANALKAWVNADGTTTAPQGGQVTYTLYADGVATQYTVTLDGTVDTAPEVTGGYESEAWKASFVNLPKYQTGTTTEIEYTIAETTTYPGYTASTTDPVASGETIINTQESTEANALKAWKNADGSTTPPEGATVEFTLYADGTATEYKVTLDGTVDTTVPTGTAGYESEVWKALFQNLPKYKVVEGAAVEIVYTVGESQGYAGYTATPAIPVASGETITNAQEDTNVNAIKAWVNADGSTTAPEGATVVFTLYADGIAKDEYTVTLDGQADETAPTVTGGYEIEAWKASFVNLPKYQADGTTEIVYTIAETTGYTGYKASTTEPVASGETITNSQLSAEIKLLKIGDGQTSTTLDNAEFELYSTWNGAGSASNVKAKDIYGEEVGTIRTTGGGLATIGKLLPGTYYLVETKAPDGYNMLTDPVEINIQLVDNETGYMVTYNQKDYSQSMSGPLSPDTDGAYQITVSDPSGVSLPHTGGPGTLLYTLSGLMLILGSALMYGFRLRRRERRLH